MVSLKLSKILLTDTFDFTRMLTIAVHFKMNMNIVCRKSRIKTRLTQNGIDQEKRYNMLSTGIFLFLSVSSGSQETKCYI